MVKRFAIWYFMTPMPGKNSNYPFTAIVGQQDMKRALILPLINPEIGGVLIRGERGTGKSTAVRSLARLLPPIQVVSGCAFRCHPTDADRMCPDCRSRFLSGDALPRENSPMRVVDLPLGATEEMVLGTLDIEKAVRQGRRSFEPGLLARAHRGFLYVDEVNLLPDHLMDILLDVAAMGVNVVEREGISFAHPSRFVLVGTMNPDEGELRPQLQDRFALCADVKGIPDLVRRGEVVTRRLLFERHPERFAGEWREREAKLVERILAARELARRVELGDGMLGWITRLSTAAGADGHRADIGMARTAMAMAAFDRRDAVNREDVEAAARLVLPHRLGPDRAEESPPLERIEQFLSEIPSGDPRNPEALAPAMQRKKKA